MINIFILKGPQEGHSYGVEGEEILIGRGPNNDIQIKDRSISRNHLRVIKRDGKYFIEDLNSSNGTFIKGEQILSGQEYEVEVGRAIITGNTIISIGQPSSEDILTSFDAGDEQGEGTRTALFKVHKDRPLTTPKNLELIYKVANILMQSFDIHEILVKILDYIFELLKRIDRGAIILTDEATGEVSRVISRTARKDDKAFIMYSRSVVKKVLQEGQTVEMRDTFGQEDANLSESMVKMKIKSVMCVPLISRSKIRGVVYVDSLEEPFGFRKEDVALLTALSSPAAIAIENALLHTNQEKVIEERTKSLRETEKRLRENESRYKAMFNNMSSGVIIYNRVQDKRDFCILDLNEAAQRIENVRKKEVLGKGITDLFPVFEEQGILETFRRVHKTARPENMSIHLSQHGAAGGWREYYIYRLPSGEIVTIFDDLTEKKKAMLEQEALQKQLLVSQKMESIGAFAGGTAHNFRNILQAISGNIEYLEMLYGKYPQVVELASNIHSSIEKGIGLINNLLHFSQRGGEYDMEDLDLGDVIMQTYAIIEKVLNKSIRIQLDLEKDLFVRGNQSLLSQAFMNLFTNARDAMPNGGQLLIQTKREEKEIVARVSDTGHGMEEEVLEKIFDPFFTLKDVGKGTGLGLSTTLGIIERHQGKISVTSKLGKGTTFTIELPLAAAGKVQQPNMKRQIVFGKGQKVLIVDDERPSLDSLANLIEALGYRPISVDNPSEAIENYQEWDPDIVLMDRNMPEMDGIACMRKILDLDPKVKIVIVSGYEESGSDGIDENTKCMIKGYLTKPCRVEDLSSTLSDLLEASE